MHLLWLKMYAPAVEEHSSAPLDADDFEEISRLVEESLDDGPELDPASALLSGPERQPLPSATRIRRVAPSPTLSASTPTEEPTLVEIPEAVPARLGKRSPARGSATRKAARS